MSSKDAPQKMQFLGTIKKLASLFPRLQNVKWRKTPTNSTVIEPKYVRLPMFLQIPRALEQGQYEFTGLCVKYGPPKNGLIALLLTTNGLMCIKYVSQKRNEAIDNCQSYRMLLNFIL